jgi:hypothetical protein
MTDNAPITEVVLTSDLLDDCLDVESLSPAAEVVLDAYMKGFGWLDGPTKKDGRCIAATLRAVADQVMPPTIPCHIENLKIRCYILGIAEELELP